MPVAELRFRPPYRQDVDPFGLQHDIAMPPTVHVLVAADHVPMLLFLGEFGLRRFQSEWAKCCVPCALKPGQKLTTARSAGSLHVNVGSYSPGER